MSDAKGGALYLSIVRWTRASLEAGEGFARRMALGTDSNSEMILGQGCRGGGRNEKNAMENPSRRQTERERETDPIPIHPSRFVEARTSIHLGGIHLGVPPRLTWPVVRKSTYENRVGRKSRGSLRKKRSSECRLHTTRLPKSLFFGGLLLYTGCSFFKHARSFHRTLLHRLRRVNVIFHSPPDISDLSKYYFFTLHVHYRGGSSGQVEKSLNDIARTRASKRQSLSCVPQIISSTQDWTRSARKRKETRGKKDENPVTKTGCR